MNPAILEARNVRITRGGVLVLDISSLAVAEGETLSLIGPNGAGKTTLMQAMAGLLKLSGGELFFRGKPVSSNHRLLGYRRRLAMVFQDPLLFDTTVFENVAAGLKIRGMPKQETEAAVRQELELLGISHLVHRSARKISGGEAQRVALARALATRPEVLFLDEPFASLDPPTRESLVNDLEPILRGAGTTTLLATHDRMEALRLSDRIAVMDGGKILQMGPPAEVMNQPLNEFVASFVGVETILTGRVIRKERGSFVASIEGREIEATGDLEPGQPVVLCIRPENVTLSVYPHKDSSSARNVFPAEIRRIIPLGHFYKIELDCTFPLVAYVTAHSVENLSLETGRLVIASFKATAVHVIRKTGVPEFGS